jgi:hypothetical protein
VIDLYYLDESGFAPTLPTGYTWTRRGRRALVRYEAPQGRRVNVVGAWAPYAPDGPRLVFESRCREQGRYDGAAHLRFVQQVVAQVPAERTADWQRARPCVVVLDNYSVHHSRVVTAAEPDLRASGVQFFFLPPYSPELNRIEPVWRHVKYEAIPERSHLTAVALHQAVDDALTREADRLSQTTKNLS